VLHPPNDIVIDAVANEMQRLSYYSLNVLTENEPFDSVLRPMLGYWNSLNLGGHLPRMNDLPPNSDAARSMQSELTLIDVSDPDPTNFLIEKHRECSNVPWLGQQLENKPLVEFPCQFIFRSMATEYLGVRELKEPRYQEAEQIIGGVTRHFVRLLLPVADDKKNVTKILIATRRYYDPYKLPV
jgi:hypothetical protein